MNFFGKPNPFLCRHCSHEVQGLGPVNSLWIFMLPLDLVSYLYTGRNSGCAQLPFKRSTLFSSWVDRKLNSKGLFYH